MSTVAYLGPENTNTHFAARRRFGTRYEYVDAPTVEDVFQLVERRKADYGVVPVENSLEGSVRHTLDRFIDFPDSPIRIFGEIEQPIQHYLIRRASTPQERIRAIFSHSQALEQCRKWLQRNYPAASLRETGSTAEAIRYLFDKEASIAFDLDERAAIGRRELAVAHRLKWVPVPTPQQNRTRFLILSRRRSRFSRKSKTSLMFSLKDRPGALHDTLVPFKQYQINLTKIESRPTKRRAWEYIFFIDFEGHESEPRVRRALKLLKNSTSAFRVLGSYPVRKG